MTVENYLYNQAKQMEKISVRYNQLTEEYKLLVQILTPVIVEN